MNNFKEALEIKLELGGQEFVFRTNDYAFQADGNCTIQCGETIMLATAGMGNARPDLGFFPLMVDFQEKFYAAGRLKHSRVNKREGRPSDQGILNSRMVDRPIRPLFPKGMVNDVQILLTPLAFDKEHELSAMGITAASTALMLSGIPFDGPCAGVKVALIDGEIITNPTLSQLENSDLDLVVAGTENAITMVESVANEVDFDTMLKALEMAHKDIVELCKVQRQLAEKLGVEALEPTLKLPDEKLVALVSEKVDYSKLLEITVPTKKALKKELKVLLAELEEKLINEIAEHEIPSGLIKEVFNEHLVKAMRENIIKNNKRLDGRDADQVRSLRSKVGVLPRVHGSGLFQRGETQVLSVVTLGGPSSKLVVEFMEGDSEKRYMHHYNFPPFCVGDVKPMRGTSRREIGHGMLGERALMAVLPSEEEFAYVIRVVSEVLACNGSSSMASVCGSTLSLMDAGVPIKRPVAGIAMGLVTSDEGYKILTDIQGMEDGCGDMDFKVTATKQGITALQMDIKLKGLDMNLLKEALDKARNALDIIEAEIVSTINAPREQLSQYAPIIETIQIDPDYIRDVIGKGGETIQRITAETETEISIEQDGAVTITAPDREAYLKAEAQIKTIAFEPEPGQTFDGKVMRVESFGAFVEFAPGKSGLVHVSKFAPERIENLTEHVKVGDTLKVKLVEKDREGRYNLSHKEFYKKD
ncbi:polyribonucleotide nucleotidyltransferase [bacterium]|jgi:polyribonucleotide nucleotidyltransferase|nr:polyribonucleotide nucleotidyltransferase [bacterium]